MTMFGWLVVALALGLAAWAAVQVFALREEMRQLQHGGQYLDTAMKNFKEEIQRSVQVTRSHLARLNTGEKLDHEMVIEGMPWADVNADQAQELLARDPAVLLLDVRSVGEYSRGHIPGAKLIPVDDLGRRLKELPEDKTRPILVHCQSGGRSLSACDYLSTQGFASLYNLKGGVGGWRGALEQGSPLGG